MPELMKGKRGLVMGVANDHSIAWGIARALAAEGAELAFSHQGEALLRRVQPLAAQVGSDLLVDVDVMDEARMDAAFARLADAWGSLDFVVHAIAYSDKSELTGRFIDTSLANFQKTLAISCYSLIDVARRSRPLMVSQDEGLQGGSIMTLTYQGSNKVTPFYNVMGVAKAGLEATVRYLANDLGPEGIRVNAISPGPMKTLAGAAIGGARRTFRHTGENAPLRMNATLEAVGGTAVYLASDHGACTTGEIIHVDSGYHILGMPQSENLKA
ncbi:enoyl-ACP reductase FabI [Roseitranquillus sediminis]|uniref:enoyl-ACP reductase FabI n=1 Tax=Roseitranquillus sediminis TaxID=2809051 RepID=UPI001D0CAA00|nr:SDR family oxidoreductase [Roseitranquillus sediminis]MBM9593078.1 SDR family oxidoreductase [Roseitranquillus sediminis]